MKLVPQMQMMRVLDEPMLQDWLAARWPRSFKALSMLFHIAAALAILLMPLLPVFGPFAVMDYTRTTSMLLGDVLENTGGGTAGEAGNATFLVEGCSTEEVAAGMCCVAPAVGVSDMVLQPSSVPLAAWTTACVSLHTVCCVSFTYALLFQLAKDPSLAMIKLLWRESRVRVVTTIGSSLAYAVVAATLLPNTQHLLWLVMRSCLMLYGTHFDAIVMGWKLRMKPAVFAGMFGSKKGGRGWFTIVLAGLLGGFLVVDIIRHLLVLNVSEMTSVLDWGVANPITGNKLRLTNHQLAEAVYFTSMFFLAMTLYTMVKTNVGHSTTFVRTNFVLEYAERPGAYNEAQAQGCS